MEMFTHMFSPVDEHNKPVKRTKDKYPYSYDGFIIHRSLPNEETTHTLYSDRLHTNYYKNWSSLSNKHFGSNGDYFWDRKPENIQAFLCELLNKPDLKLVLIMEYCNLSNGYPVWRFDVKI